MKKAVIVTPFDNYSYNVRIKYLETYFREKGYESIVLSADFDHRNKCHYDVKRDNLELIHVPEYKRNLSFSRIYSHYVLAKEVRKRLEELQPDLVYGSAPPNFLFYQIGKYKKKFGKKVIFEIGDLWPETLPLSDKIKKIAYPFLYIWASLRNRHIHNSDAVIYECDLFKDKVEYYNENRINRTIYLSKEDYYHGINPDLTVNGNTVKVAYVGSINNIIDIDMIARILSLIKKFHDVQFEIIGDGENKDHLIELCSRNGIAFVDHGVVFDEKSKFEILKDCHFGMNIMKSSVVVGATMKSLEYFHWGLALINNIPADTSKLIEKYECGINVKETELLEDFFSSLDTDRMLELRKNSRSVYNKFFSESTVRKQFLEVLDEILV